ncbi:LysR substrate-binding domain-containing protein [Rhodoplanes azumiensis]|uniref:LysR substrate-binding domain-containing protein n=1 Tax=Rhodoplanes azumiensis TaxID=1897628 RepID=A0ABW5AHM1_9BRAD
MELRHLRYFVALAEELHYGRAAQRLGISQPPLSQQILQLEADLGARLLERTNRRVALTEAGRVFLAEARATLLQAERAAVMAGRAARGEAGELKIGFASSGALDPTFTETIRAFRAAVPGVRLVLEEQVTASQIEALTELRLQIGVVRSPAAPDLPPDLAAAALSREPLYAFLRADHPLAIARRGAAVPLAALADEPFVFFPPGSGTSLYDQVLGLCRKAGFRPRVEQEARANATLLGLVAVGLGVSILPASLAGFALPAVVGLPLAPAGESALWLVHRRDDPSAAAATFVAMATARRAPPAGRRRPVSAR